jgi:hypothetical protein
VPPGEEIKWKPARGSRHRVVLGSVVCLSWALASARRRPLSAWTAYVQAGCLLVGVGRLLAPG